MLGIAIVTGALIAYSIAVLTELRRKALSPVIMIFLTIGIGLDITATACMIIGSSNIPFTAHGVLGYSALLCMLIDTILTWRHWKSENKNGLVPRGLIGYTRVAYIWWVVAYLVGGMMASIPLR
jgi:hypothetical protein